MEGTAPGCAAQPPDGEIPGSGGCVQHTLVKSNFLIHLVMIDNYKGGVVNGFESDLPIVATQNVAMTYAKTLDSAVSDNQ